MKKVSLLVFMALSFSLGVMAKGNKQVKAEELPTDARVFLNAYFGGNKVDNVVVPDRSHDYEVTMDNGMEVNFDHRGNWKEVDCNEDYVPANLVPSKILNAVAKNYGIDARVIWIKRHKKGYEVELNNGVEVYFNRRFKMISKKI